MRRGRSVTGILQPIATVLAVVLLLGVPFWLVVSTAGKNQAEALNPNLAPPSQWQLFENFAQATTMSLMLFLMVTILAFPVIRFLRKREDVL